MRSTIRTPDAVLRPLGPDDAAAIARACTDPQIIRWTEVPAPYTLTDAREFVATNGGEDHVWAIDAGGLVGVIALRNIRASMPGPICEVGYWVAAWARGRGLATAALSGIRDEAEASGFERIDWHTLTGNQASVRVARKAGFVIEGLRRRAIVHRGQLVDALVGGWTRSLDIPELVAGVWQVQPVAADDVADELRPAASAAVAVWVVRTAVDGIDSGNIVALRSPAGVHVIGYGAPEPAIAAAVRYLEATGVSVTQAPPPIGWA